MNNPFMMMLQNMANQSMGNVQQFAQNLLRQNPQFAQQIQGRNLQQEAMNMLRQQGINPQSVMQMFSGR